MFSRVKRLYDQGKLDKNGVKNAVLRGWITEDQYKEITAEQATMICGPKPAKEEE